MQNNKQVDDKKIDNEVLSNANNVNKNSTNKDYKKEEIGNLVHVEKSLPWGGEVLVLNTGAIITAEDAAMLQALHSRDPKGIKSHLQKLSKTGSGNLMSNFYVGYGHKSIGDCGNAVIFVEGISMLAAKALQDNQLYNGQECSTRYIDFSNQPFIDSRGLTQDKNKIQESLREFYLKSFPILVEHIKTQNLKLASEDENVYEKAVKARAFDILRGFLPAGATTNVAWSGTLRSVADKIVYLRHHPLEEVRIMADKISDSVNEAFPNSFGFKKYEATENYTNMWMQEGYYSRVEGVSDEVKIDFDGVDREMLKLYQKYIDERPAKTELPKQVAATCSLRVSFLLDFGSWRDLQRHRSLVQLMPKLTTKYGFENWYIENLPESLRKEASELLARLEKDIESINENERQYFIPMGYKVPVILTGDLSAFTYVIEIRSTSFVHETLQRKALVMADLLQDKYNIKLYVNKEDIGRFNIKRGQQDIVEKSN